MLMNETWMDYGRGKLSNLATYFLLSTVLVLPLAGCGGNGNGESMISSLSAPTEATEDATSDIDSDPTQPNPGEEETGIAPLLVMEEEGDADVPAGVTPDLSESNSDGENQTELPPPPAPETSPTITLTSTPTGAIAQVTWQPASDSSVKGYYIYYGKQSSGEPGVCSYEGRQAVDDPSVTLAELEPNTQYFFAVSSYSVSESPCSNETSAISPPART